MLVDLISGLFIGAGGLFVLIGALGIIRLPDVFSRMQSVSLIETVGAGLLCMGWIWLKQAITAQKAINQGSNEQNFHLGKIETARYTVAYELTKLNGILERFASTQYPTLDMKTDWF